MPCNGFATRKLDVGNHCDTTSKIPSSQHSKIGQFLCPSSFQSHNPQARLVTISTEFPTKLLI
eukprot:2603061-Amphidinium_carterae.1